MNPLAYYHYVSGGNLSGLLIFIVCVVILAALAFYGIRQFIPDPFLNKLLSFVVVVVVVVALLICFLGCAANQSAGGTPALHPPTAKELRQYQATVHGAVSDYKEIKAIRHE